MNLSPEKKIAGVLAPLFALRGKDDLGVGDVAALREFIDWAAEIGFKLVQVLPINETSGDNSPYNAISAMALEPTTLHLAPGSPKDLTRQDFDIAVADVDLAQLRQGSVKYRRVKKLKRRLLEKAFLNFSLNAAEDPQADFKKFCLEEAARHRSCISKTTSSRRNGGRTGVFPFIAGRQCAETISNGGGNASASQNAHFIFFASIMSSGFIGFTLSRGDRRETRSFFHSIGTRCWREPMDAFRISRRAMIRRWRIAQRTDGKAKSICGWCLRNAAARA